jgi:uncharacterized membrane protein YfcA
MLSLAALVFFAFVAGFIDSIAGGAGLIQLPALMVFSPDKVPAVILGTGKFSSFCGTSAAAINFARRVPIFTRTVIVCGLFAFIGSLLGAAAVSYLSQASFRPVALALLCAVAMYVVFKPALGADDEAPERGSPAGAAVTGLLIGLYDGFFGPGTGSFLIFAFVTFFGFRFVKASAAAKFVNVLTNLSALGYFALHGQVNWRIAAPMAGASIVGGILGTKVAFRLGSAFVRKVFLCIVAAFILKLGYDLAF